MAKDWRKPRCLPPATHSAKVLIRIASPHVGLFRFLLEAYDNLALFTVLDRQPMLLQLLFSPHQEQAVRQALAAMNTIIPFDVQEWPSLKPA